MASNFNGDLEDSTIPENLQLSSSSESRTKSVDEVVAEMEEQNRWADKAADDKKIRKMTFSLLDYEGKTTSTSVFVMFQKN